MTSGELKGLSPRVRAWGKRTKAKFIVVKWRENPTKKLVGSSSEAGDCCETYALLFGFLSELYGSPTIPANGSLIHVGDGVFAWVPPGDVGDVWTIGTDGIPAWVPPA